MIDRLTRIGIRAATACLAALVGLVCAHTAAIGQATNEGAPAANELTVALLHPVTGPYAPLGLRARAAANLALQAINQKGGIASLNGQKITVLPIDVGVDGVSVGDAFRQLNDKAAVAAIGGTTTALALALGNAAAEAGVPLLIDAAIDDTITDQDRPTVFRFGPTYSQYLDTLAALLRWAADKRPPPAEGEETLPFRVMVLHDPGPYGTGAVAGLAERLEDTGIVFEPALELPPNLTAASRFAFRLRREDPDFVLSIAYADAQTQVLETIAKRSFRPKGVLTLLGALTTDTTLRDRSLAAMEGLGDVSAWLAPEQPGSTALQTAFARASIPMTLDTLLAHESALLLGEALDRAGAVDRAAVVEALGSSNWESAVMPFGPTDFADGQNRAAQPELVQVQDAALRLVSVDEREERGLFRYPHSE